MSTITRQSNIELLRILCMFFIVVNHFMGHSLIKYSVLNSHFELNSSHFLLGFIVVGVNCFILISGYFGIKFKLRGLFKLYLICFFYGILGYFFHLLIDNQYLGKTILNWSIFALSKSEWWFINGYIVLFFLSPFINIPINTMTKRQYILVLILLSIINLYFGYWGGKNTYNYNGFSVSQFVYLYVIGGYIRRFISLEWIKRNKYLSVICYLLCSIIVGGISIIFQSGKVFYYNNPLLIISSISLLLFFLSIPFQNKTINWLSSGVLAAYLIQDHAYAGYGFIYPKTATLFSCYLINNVSNTLLGTVYVFTLLLLYSLIFLLLILVFDHFRALLMKPLWGLYDKIESSLNDFFRSILNKLSRQKE